MAPPRVLLKRCRAPSSSVRICETFGLSLNRHILCRQQQQPATELLSSLQHTHSSVPRRSVSSNAITTSWPREESLTHQYYERNGTMSYLCDTSSLAFGCTRQRRYLATSTSDQQNNHSGAKSKRADDEIEATATIGSASNDNNSNSNNHEENNRPMYQMSMSDLESLVNEFESSSTVSELVQYIGESGLPIDEFVSQLYDLIDACAARRNRNGARLAERILGHWLHLATTHVDSTYADSKESILLPPPGRDAYTSTMNAWADANTRGGYGAKRAQEIMDLMVASMSSTVSEVGESHEDITSSNNGPDIGTYMALLKAWAKSGEASAPHRAMDVLKDLEDRAGITILLHDSNESVNRLNLAFVADRVCHNLVCQAWSKSLNPRAPDEIRSVMSRMEAVANALGMDEYRPNTKTWNMLIHSYARLGQDQRRGQGNRQRRGRPFHSPPTLEGEDLALAAESTLREMHDLYREQVKNGKVMPYADGDNGNDDDGRSMDAENIIRPNITSYNGVLNAWSNIRRTDRAALRAEEILTMLLSKDGSAGDDTNDLPICPGAHPNLITYNTIIKCWARSGSPEAGKRAEAMLGFMNGNIFGRNYLFHPITKAARWRSDVVRPNVVTYNTTMDAWSKSGLQDGAKRAEKLLRMIMDHPPGADGPIKPNAISFATVIHAWSNSSDDSAAEKAEALLNEMNDLYRSTGDQSLKPTRACFTSVIFAHTNRGHIDEAENVLETMRLSGIPPPTNVYNAVLEGYSRVDPLAYTERGTKTFLVQQARSILEDMMSLGEDSKGSAPDATSFDHFLHICANCAKGDKPMRRTSRKIALSTLYKMRQYENFEIDSTTYVDMFQLVGKLMPKKSVERTDAYGHLFEACCQDGMLIKHLLHLISHAVPANDLRRMLGLPEDASIDLMSLSLSDLPSQWSANGRRRSEPGLQNEWSANAKRRKPKTARHRNK